MRSPDITILYYFSTIIQERSMSRAARILCVNQPTLSKKITFLEEYLGVKLFERNHKPMVPTDEGLKFAHQLNQIFDFIRMVKNQGSIANTELSGEIHIHCDGTVMESPILSLSTKFYETYPQVTFDYRMDSEYVLDSGITVVNSIDDVTSGRIIGAFPPQRFGLLAPIGVPFNTGEITMQDILSYYNIYIPETYGITSLYNLSDKTHPCNDIRKAEHYVISGMGLAAVPMNMSTHLCRTDLDIIPLTPEIVINPILVTNKVGLISPVERAFVDFMASSGLININ